MYTQSYPCPEKVDRLFLIDPSAQGKTKKEAVAASNNTSKIVKTKRKKQQQGNKKIEAWKVQNLLANLMLETLWNLKMRVKRQKTCVY